MQGNTARPATPPYLTDDELRYIAQPLVQPKAILRWFRNNGFPDAIQRPNGLPLIRRADFYTPRQVAESPVAEKKDGIVLDFSEYIKRFAPHGKPGRAV